MPGLQDVTRGRLLYGGDYNPEQWPPHVWAQDVALMRQARVNLVTVGVFAWAALQPAPNRFTFDDLDVASAELGDFTATMWAEWAVARGADTVAAVRGGALHGRPVLFRHRFGAGVAWYVATLPAATAMRRLLRRVCADAGVAPVLPDLPPHVEAVRRGGLVFLLHHDTGQVEIRREGHRDTAPD